MSNEEPKVDWKQLQSAVLQRLDAKMKMMNETDRETPFFHIQDPETLEQVYLSLFDIYIEVKNMTPLGKKYMVAQLLLIKQLQP